MNNEKLEITKLSTPYQVGALHKLNDTAMLIPEQTPDYVSGFRISVKISIQSTLYQQEIKYGNEESEISTEMFLNGTQVVSRHS